MFSMFYHASTNEPIKFEMRDCSTDPFDTTVWIGEVCIFLSPRQLAELVSLGVKRLVELGINADKALLSPEADLSADLSVDLNDKDNPTEQPSAS